MNNEQQIIALLTDIKGLLEVFKDSGLVDKVPRKVSKPKFKADDRFDEFYAIYPKKVDGKGARNKWMSRGLNKIADKLIADVKNRVQNDSKWIDGYAPNPTTYLNGDRWEDDIQAAIQPVTKVNPAEYIIPQDWKERGIEVLLRPFDNEKYIDFRNRVLESEKRR